MSSEKPENPVMLWGDMGPDVYQLSQIYDPRNDQYVLTLDSRVVDGKDYYRRLSLILSLDESVTAGRTYYRNVGDEFEPVVNPTGSPKEQGWYQDVGGKVLVFTKITDIPTDANPEELHWYEKNADAVNTCGKYVPAVDSLVVVDADECLYKVENRYKTRMLLTVKSVDEWFNVTFANIVFGSEIEETVRAIDYGNEKFMLFFDRRGEAASYNNQLLTVDRKIMLYGKSSYAYRLKVNGAVISTNKQTIQVGVGGDALIPFVRATAKKFLIKTTGSDANYETLAASGSYFDVVLPNGLQKTLKFEGLDLEDLIPTCDTVFAANKNYYSSDVASDATKINLSEWEGKNISTYPGLVYCKVVDDLDGRLAFGYEDTSATVNNVYIPERCYLKSGMSLVDGEAVEMEIFMLDADKFARLCMSVTLTAKEASALDQTDVTTRQIVKFDVDLNGSSEYGDVWYLQQGEDWAQAFQILPKVTFDDGSVMKVPVDGKSCFMYGFENITNKLVGKEYQVLFKFYPHHTLNIDWQRLGLTPTKHYVTCRKTVKIINDMSYKIRKISLIPAWNHEANIYEFYFMIFRNDYVSPPIIRRNLDTRFTVGAYQLSEDITADLTKEYYSKANGGKFVKINGVTAASRPKANGWYEYILNNKTSLIDISIFNDGSKTVIDTASAGDVMGVIQHAILAERVFANGINATNVYTQPVAFKLQRMNLPAVTENPLLEKWLIGDDTSRTEIVLPYGSSVDRDGVSVLRPFVVYDEEDGVHTYHIPKAAVGVAGFDYAVIDDVPTGSFLEAFWKNAQPPNGTFGEENVETTEFQPTHFFYRALNDDSIVSQMIPITEFDTAISLEGGGESAAVIGGLIPTEITDDMYGTGRRLVLHGTCIIEFVHQYTDPEDPTKYKYKHLYAVPVEVITKTEWEAIA